MKKILLLLALFSSYLQAENVTLDNQTLHPLKNAKSKMALQWASSAKEMEEGSQGSGLKLSKAKLQAISQQGRISLTLPNEARYFRLLVWTKGQKEPDLLTSWVEVTADKVYSLKADHLMPTVLLCGTGC